MSLNIMELAKNYLTPELISKTAGQLGESESGVTKAISGLLPTILGGVAQNGVSGGMLDSLKGLATSNVLSNLGANESSSLVGNIVSSLFGDKLGGILSGISSFAGIKESSASSLMNLASGAALGSLGKHAVDHNLDASSFGSLLDSQKSSIASLLPAGLGALGLGALGSSVTGGLGDVAGKVGNAASAVTGGLGSAAGKLGDAANFNAPKGGGGSFLKWLLPLLLLGALAFFAFKKCGKGTDAAMEDAEGTTEMTADSLSGAQDSTSVAATSGDATAVAGATAESTMVKLPSGKELNAKKGGIEEQLATFLGSEEFKTATPEALKQKWFSFDNLNFEFGKTILTTDSKVQLDNIVAILKEFKEVKIKVGAYTDKKGDDKVNKALSQRRADAVKEALKKAGVGAQVTGAEGYGEEFAKVDESASDEERKADRKTAIRIEK